jgi:hypothetical protein
VTVATGASVLFSAPEIHLRPGFVVQPGSFFQVRAELPTDPAGMTWTRDFAYRDGSLVTTLEADLLVSVVSRRNCTGHGPLAFLDGRPLADQGLVCESQPTRRLRSIPRRRRETRPRKHERARCDYAPVSSHRS